MSWTARPTKSLFRRLEEAGFDVDDRMRDGLQELLDGINGETDAALSPAELLQTLLDASASSDEFAFRAAAGAGETATACMVVRASYQRWVVGVTTCNARSPRGCAAWKLAKWQDGGDNTKLLSSWAIKFDASKLGVNWTPKTTQTRTTQDDTEEAQLLAQIMAAPADDGPRLVYADWLATRDPARSEIIVLQIQAETLKGKKRDALEARADELRSAHSKRWYGGWCTMTYRRGFPYAIATEVGPLIEKGPKLFATTPLDYVAVEFQVVDDITRFAAFSQLARITTLELNTYGMSFDEVLRALAANKAFGHLRTLVLRADLSLVEARILAKPTTLPGLTTILTEYAIRAEVRRTLAARKLKLGQL